MRFLKSLNSDTLILLSTLKKRSSKMVGLEERKAELSEKGGKVWKKVMGNPFQGLPDGLGLCHFRVRAMGACFEPGDAFQ